MRGAYSLGQGDFRSGNGSDDEFSAERPGKQEAKALAGDVFDIDHEVDAERLLQVLEARDFILLLDFEQAELVHKGERVQVLHLRADEPELPHGFFRVEHGNQRRLSLDGRIVNVDQAVFGARVQQVVLPGMERHLRDVFRMIFVVALQVSLLS